MIFIGRVHSVCDCSILFFLLFSPECSDRPLDEPVDDLEGAQDAHAGEEAEIATYGKNDYFSLVFCVTVEAHDTQCSQPSDEVDLLVPEDLRDGARHDLDLHDGHCVAGKASLKGRRVLNFL